MFQIISTSLSLINYQNNIMKLYTDNKKFKNTDEVKPSKTKMWYKQNHPKSHQFQSLQQQYYQQSDQELQPSSHVPIPTIDDYERGNEVYREYGYKDTRKEFQKVPDARGEYQLTFKKDKGGIDGLSGDFGYARQRLFDAQNPQQQRHKQQQNSEWNLVLTTIKSKKTITQILKTLSQTHQTPTSLLSHLLQFKKISHHLLNNQKTTILQSLIMLLSLKIYRKKRINAKLNLQYIRLILEEYKDKDKEKDISQADKKKQQLLKMLVWQLQKKILVLGLRYNWVGVVGRRMGLGVGMEGGVLSEGEENDEEGLELDGYDNLGKYTNRTQKEIQTKRQEMVIMKGQKNIKGNNVNNNNSCYHQSTRLSVFSQILSSLVNKSIFSVFRKLSETLLDKQTHYNEHEHEHEHDYQQEYGHEHGHEHYLQNEAQQQNSQNKELDYQDEPRNTQTDHQKDPIQSITDYINTLKQKLKHFPRNEHEILNNYFIKWKIYFLFQIIRKIEEQNNYISQDISNQYGYTNTNTNTNTNINRNTNTNTKANKYTNRNDQDNVQVQQYGSVRDADGDLKEEKSVLKRYLKVRSARSVFRVLAENRANGSIKDVMRGYYVRALQRKAFTAIFINKQQAQIQKYAEQLAQTQQQHHQTTSKIFFNTTTLTKSFFALKNLTRHSKFFKILSKFIISHIFTSLKQNTIKQKQNEEKEYKLNARKNKILLFMCFNAIKNQTSFSEYRQTLVENFRRKRKLEIMEFCFSGLKLEVKKGLVNRRKIQNFVGVNNVRRFFWNLRENFMSMSDFQSRSHVVYKFVAAYKKLMFFQHFRRYTADRKRDKRLEIKGLKLNMQKVRRKAKQSLGRWRKQTICRKNYRVVEVKLTKVKQVEAKQRILLIWLNRLRQKHRDERKDRLTNDHKIWLNKYYERLCALEQQQP